MPRPNAWYGAAALFLPLLIVSGAPRACAQEAPKDPPKEQPKGEPAGAPAKEPENPQAKPEPPQEKDPGAAPAKEPDAKAPPAAPAGAAFVQVPAGQVHPGCTDKEYAERHRGNNDLKNVLRYEIWGSFPPFPIPAFSIGKHEVTNAQWKHYLDQEFRVVHTTQKGDTLKGIAEQYVQFRGLPVTSEWKSIYAINWQPLVEAWKKAELWEPAWSVDNPPAAAGKTVEDFAIPEGLKLIVYKTRVPQNWYGWCRLSGFGIGFEYCDPSKPDAEAFNVPKDDPFKSLKIGDTDFAAYPVRSVSVNEMFAFAEWAGCQLPTEYEYERAARGDNLRLPYCFGPWNPGKQPTLIAGGDNERSMSYGPMRVDDPSVSGGDSPYGARHMHGNVWEMTRTFYDVHPRVVPAPPSPGDIANYALVAKGGSYGDRWQLLTVSARTGIVGEKGELSLRDNNRADSLGLRLVRHADRPGFDMMLHSIRRLGYDAGAGVWTSYPPHAFAHDRTVGVDDVKIVDSPAPYVHATKRAHAVCVTPLLVTEMNEAAKRSDKPERNRYKVLGAFRSDVAFKAGVCLTDAEKKALLEKRDMYQKYLDAIEKLPPAKRKITKPPSDPPAPPDEYEKLTEKHQAELGLFREKEVAAGEWFVVWWNGYIGLANKNFTMPPDAILAVNPKQVTRKNDPAGPSQVTLDGPTGEIRIRFQVTEQPTDKAKQIVPPGPELSEEWALYEACPSLFIKGPPRPNCWEIDIAFKIASADDPVWKSLVSDSPRKPEPPEDKKSTGK